MRKLLGAGPAVGGALGALAFAQMPNKGVIHFAFGIEHETGLRELDLVQKKHHHNRERECYQRCIKRNAQTLRHAGDMARGCVLRLL